MRIVFSTLVIVMLLAPSLGYARLDEDLVLYYPFDEVATIWGSLKTGF